MKTVVLGDIHGRSVWKQITEKENPDKVIFIGDYFDSFDISGVEQLHNFKEIIEYKESGSSEVVLLIGNHDYHYMPGIDEDYSGYQHAIAPSIQQVLEENKNHLRMAYQMDEFLFSHAGVSSKFMDSVFGKGDWKVENLAIDLHEMFKFKPRSFMFGVAVNPDQWYIDPYGDNEEQSPIWIRPKSLMRANRDTLRKEVIQVAGHTQVREVDVKGHGTGSRYWFIDCLGTSGQYMVITDGKVDFNKI